MREGWTETTISDLLEVSIGGVWGSDPGVDEIDVSVYRQTEFDDNGTLSMPSDAIRSITKNQLKSRTLQPGDVLMQKSAGTPTLPGRVVIVPSGIERNATCSNFLHLLRAKPNNCNPHFLFWYLWLNHQSGRAFEFQRGTNIKNLDLNQYLAQAVSLPPIEEQKRIVDVVSSVDAYIDTLQERADTTRAARNAVLHELISACGDDWTETTIGSECIVKGGKRLPKGTPWSENPTAHPYIRATDFRNGRIDTSNLVYVPEDVWPVVSRYVVQASDVLITIAGTIGAIALVPSSHIGANLTENAALIRPASASLDSEFLYLWLLSDDAQRQIADLTIGTTQQKLGLFRIESIQLRLPPFDEQKRIVEIVLSMDDVVQKTEQAVTDAKNLRSGLLSDLLSGKHEIPASYDKYVGAA
jgi:type I restriction enzyme S subunit